MLEMERLELAVGWPIVIKSYLNIQHNLKGFSILKFYFKQIQFDL